MAVFSDLQYPTTSATRLIAGGLAVVLFLFLAVVGMSGFLLYRIVSPAGPESDLRIEELLGNPSDVLFPVPRGKNREGWFFPGLKRAPTIILCHGYQSHRGAVLTLVSTLQEHQFNVFAFDFAGHGTSRGFTTLGYEETKELQAAVGAVAQRDDVDRARFGVWGMNLGGYAALGAAAADSRIRAVAVDSVYDEPSQMLRLQIERFGLDRIPFVGAFCRLEYYLANFRSRQAGSLSQRMNRLAGVAKLFIQLRVNPALAESTRELFLRSPEPRRQLIIPGSSYPAMMDEDKRAYENQVVNFFLQNLPPSSTPVR
jgi:pimeloyl-ACP methyl ester carboxylesterase